MFRLDINWVAWVSYSRLFCNYDWLASGWDLITGMDGVLGGKERGGEGGSDLFPGIF